ncbi:MAG TPA: YbhB/YbcL family Raf kinase inhibitor-like protein [Candidatus Paceibacterota bacterium]|nr:YbhB/YbcL family Raf kinase inhibitor-like protein [Candidatus Paceibacterota bacterium]
MEELKPLIVTFVVLFVIIGFFLFIFQDKEPAMTETPDQTKQENGITLQKEMEKLTIKSSAFKNNDSIPPKYTCDGDNVNPLIEILNVPKEAKSLALVMEDPDATGGVTWDHWLLWNIDPQTNYIEEDNVPSGAVQGRTSFGSARYGGPCPPRGSKPHRYMFRVYALDTVLNLAEGEPKSALLKAMEGHVLAEGLLIGLYERQ